MTRQKAFTLVELLVVISIISLLISILAPSLNVAKDLTKQIVCSSNMNSACKGILLYCDMNQDRFPPYQQSARNGVPYVNDTYVCVERTMWAAKVGQVDPVTLRQRFRGVGIIYDTRFVEDPRLFYCPAQANPSFIYDEYVIDRAKSPPVSKPWGTVDNSSSMVRMGYFFNTWGEFYASENRWDVAYRTLSGMESNRALQIDHAVFPWLVPVHTAKGHTVPTFNVAFGDGHVEPYSSSTIMDALLIHWGDPTGGVLKNWKDNGAVKGYDDWHEIYELILTGT